MTQSQLEKYISDFSAEYSRESITKQLLAAGVPKEEIDKAYAKFGNTSHKKKAKKKIIFTLLLLIIFAGLVYFALEFGSQTLIPSNLLSNSADSNDLPDLVPVTPEEVPLEEKILVKNLLVEGRIILINSENEDILIQSISLDDCNNIFEKSLVKDSELNLDLNCDVNEDQNYEVSIQTDKGTFSTQISAR